MSIIERLRELLAETPAEMDNDYLKALWGRPYRYDFELKNEPAGQRLLAAGPQQQREFVRRAVALLERPLPSPRHTGPWMVTEALATLLRRKLPLDQDDMLALMRCGARHTLAWRLEAHVVKAVEHYLAEHPRTPALDAGLAELIAALEARAFGADQRRRLLRLKELAGFAAPELPLQPGDAWADAAIAELATRAPDQRASWLALLRHCAAASGSAPSAKWLKAARPLVDTVGAEPFRSALRRWLALAEQPRAEPIADARFAHLPPDLLQDRNTDILKGLIWLCAEHGDADSARALMALAIWAYRKLPGIGPRCARLGNACIWALAQMPGHDGIAQLAVLKARVRLASAQRLIESALQSAAERAGLRPGELEELLVPSFGLEDAGLRRERLGDVTAELAIERGGVELRYLRPDGRRLAAAPRTLREQHGQQLKALAQAAADIRQMLTAQRDRIEQLYLQQRDWRLDTWRERYLDHPLVGTLARRLIWRFEAGGEPVSGIWHAGQIVAPDGRPIDLGAAARVALWHPLDSPTEEVLAWRDWLAAHEVQQPFKQAYREIYLLTDAERATRVYSNRFAAHIIRQHQFNALCDARGWKNQLRLMVDDSYPPATRLLPAWGLRAEYWVEGAGSEYGTDTNATGTYNFLATDQVRFYALDAAQHYAHAGGGGYHGPRGSQPAGAPIELSQIPALVFSEVMRDVDLFVGVASIANDPAWADGGPNGGYRDYWRHYAFGELSEAAKTRGEVLARVVPRLAIAPRCRLTDRFLVVRGDLRTYKIHLGSGNIMMEPNDQYLCIVPARGSAAPSAEGTRFIPFEGDTTLAIILSKALLLANDTAIDDPTIVRQIRC
jgi:hypothetical protein